MQFSNFVASLDPKYDLPSYTQLKDSLFPMAYDNLVQVIQLKLNECQIVALTTDMWSSPANEGLITTTCHFLLKSKLESVVLDTELVRGSHTAATIQMVCHSLKKKKYFSHFEIGVT